MQTDFGNIYFNKPKEVYFPKSVEELSLLLKKLNTENKKVTIRNTGHSVNGQTLTKEYQIDLSNISYANFDKENLEVLVGAGTSWSDVFKNINFPEYSIAVFPNNPGQKIHIGGTASVGGVGTYSFKYGGFWNHIKEIKLVLMNGDIVNCSNSENEEYFKFAIAGFGQIGVIAELKIEVIPSEKNVVVFEILNFSDEKYFKNIKKLLSLDEVVGLNGISKGGSFFQTSPNALMVVLESKNMKKDLSVIREKIGGDINFVLKEHKKEYYDFNLGYKEIKKKTIFDYYPIDLKRNHIEGIHPWSDYILPESSYLYFLGEIRKVIKAYDLEKRIITQSFLNGLFSINMMPTYIGKNFKKGFPLVPEIQNEEYSYGIGFMPTIEKSEIKKTLEAIYVLTDICFEAGGKRYLYGINNLSEKQKELQFGKENLKSFRELKEKLDPKNLLNSNNKF